MAPFTFVRGGAHIGNCQLAEATQLRLIADNPAGSTALKILLLEFDDITRKQVAQMIVASGHVVDECRDGPDAAALAQTNYFAVLNVDRMVAGLDGLRVVKAVRAATSRNQN